MAVYVSQGEYMKSLPPEGVLTMTSEHILRIKFLGFFVKLIWDE